MRKPCVLCGLSIFQNKYLISYQANVLRYTRDDLSFIPNAIRGWRVKPAMTVAVHRSPCTVYRVTLYRSPFTVYPAPFTSKLNCTVIRNLPSIFIHIYYKSISSSCVKTIIANPIPITIVTIIIIKIQLMITRRY